MAITLFEAMLLTDAESSRLIDLLSDPNTVTFCNFCHYDGDDVQPYDHYCLTCHCDEPEGWKGA